MMGFIGANSGRISQLIRASGKLRRSADSAGSAITISPSALGLISRIFSYGPTIGPGFYAKARTKAIAIG